MAVEVDPIILMMCTAGEVKLPYSAVGIRELEYTTANMEMKQELSVSVSLLSHSQYHSVTSVR